MKNTAFGFWWRRRKSDVAVAGFAQGHRELVAAQRAGQAHQDRGPDGAPRPAAGISAR